MPELKVFLSYAALAEFDEELRQLAQTGRVKIGLHKPETVECVLIAIREYYRTRRG